MGWNSGTILFDVVVDKLVENEVHSSTIISVAEALARELKYMDWDGACESMWWDNPEIGRVLGNKFEDDEEEEE